MTKSSAIKQLFRYGLVGLSLNLAGYGIYLLITWLGVNPKIVISITYPIAATLSYFANKQWTFSHTGKHWKSITKYIFAHSMGYGLNLLLLFYFVDILNIPHQLVQAAAIFIVAGFLFITFRLFVFSPQSNTIELK